MNFLFVDSCQNELFVLLYNNGEIFYATSSGNKKHNSILLPKVDELLEKSGLKINEIENIACVVGPGSFTGIRLGVSTCNAIAFAIGSKRIAINTFESIAYNNINNILVALDCRHGNYYAGEYDNGKEVALLNITDNDISDFKGEVVIWNGERNIESIVNCVKDKIEKENFVDIFVPLYLKKSQAEREAE